MAEKNVCPATDKLLSLFWIVLSANFIFCDVFSLMYAPDLRQILAGNVGGTAITEKFLFAFAVIMEVPMMMILLSRILKYRLNRVLNLIFALLLIIIQTGSLGVGEVTLHYIFFSVVEILLCLAIIVTAVRWKTE